MLLQAATYCYEVEASYFAGASIYKICMNENHFIPTTSSPPPPLTSFNL